MYIFSCPVIVVNKLSVIGKFLYKICVIGKCGGGLVWKSSKKKLKGKHGGSTVSKRSL
jgi:hypothetical protein